MQGFIRTGREMWPETRAGDVTRTNDRRCVEFPGNDPGREHEDEGVLFLVRLHRGSYEPDRVAAWTWEDMLNVERSKISERDIRQAMDIEVVSLDP